MVRRIKSLEVLSVRVRPPCSYKDGFYRRDIVKIVGKSSLHGLIVFEEGQSVDLHTGCNEFFYLIKRVCCLDVHALDSIVRAITSEALAVKSA
jgi:hypothetical protein